MIRKESVISSQESEVEVGAYAKLRVASAFSSIIAFEQDTGPLCYLG